MIQKKTRILSASLLVVFSSTANELVIGTFCPVEYANQSLGILAFSHPWYHDGMQSAAYHPRDNDIGVGLEIHFFANITGQIDKGNLAQCDNYRIIQTRYTSAIIPGHQKSLQLDIPQDFDQPYYDSEPLEFGRGNHNTPVDSSDKPWANQTTRSSTVAIYDTPFVSDIFGVDGQDIKVQFETCIVCQREQGYDLILGCGNWGFIREHTDVNEWAEPDFISVQCQSSPSDEYTETLNSSTQVDYEYWLDWR